MSIIAMKACRRVECAGSSGRRQMRTSRPPPVRRDGLVTFLTTELGTESLERAKTYFELREGIANDDSAQLTVDGNVVTDERLWGEIIGRPIPSQEKVPCPGMVARLASCQA